MTGSCFLLLLMARFSLEFYISHNYTCDTAIQPTYTYLLTCNRNEYNPRLQSVYAKKRNIFYVQPCRTGQCYKYRIKSQNLHL